MNSKAKSSNITTSTATAHTSTLNEATSNMIVFDKHGCSTLLKKYPQLKSSIVRMLQKRAFTTELDRFLGKKSS